MYLRNAIAQYRKGSTTMSERIQQLEKITNPVFIICPELGFQPSYFKNFDFTVYTGISSFVWKFPWFSEAVLANKSIPEAHKNMSLILGKYLVIALFKNFLAW